MSEKTILKKKFDNRTTLEMVSFVSDIVSPGRHFYQLSLRDGNITTNFPADWENYSQNEIGEMYDSINSESEALRCWERAVENE
jgi:hypothetical protein